MPTTASALSHVAALAVDWLLVDGKRTASRLDSLVDHFAPTYGYYLDQAEGIAEFKVEARAYAVDRLRGFVVDEA